MPKLPQKAIKNTPKYLPDTSNDQGQKTQIHPLKFKTIIPTDIQTKKSLWLRFRYDEKYTTGQVCKNTMLYFMLVDDKEVVKTEGEGKLIEACEEEEIMEISINALWES